ncbi:Scr1 family TA system antitoxin-like transcriptional regulator [Streptomyces sp. NPDC005955]|uniref:DUF5753 domain-containing protein n=1 Tax=Streptomyces sp. NPDC005955 TaxID=3364738 RepID=UPI0036B75C1E
MATPPALPDPGYVTWTELHKDGLRPIQEQTVPLYQRTESFRVYASNVIPGMLQTAGYATGLLRSITKFQGTPDDVAEAAAARLARSRVVHDEHRHFSFLIEEAVLSYPVCDDTDLREQLEHLLTFVERQNVALGVIPRRAPRTVWPLEAFYAFDDERVDVETLTAEINVTDAAEVGAYLRAFAALSLSAVRGAAAEALIRSALAPLD